MSTELSGRGYGTDMPRETGGETEHPDAKYVPATAGENAGMTRAEAFVQRDAARATRDNAIGGAAETGGQREGAAAGSDAGPGANDEPAADSTGTGQGNNAREDGDAGAVPAHAAGGRAGNGPVEGGDGNAVVEGSSERGGPVEGVGTPTPDPVSGTDEVSESSDQWPGPLDDVKPGHGVAGSGAEDPGTGAEGVGDGDQDETPDGRGADDSRGSFGRAGDSLDARAEGSRDWDEGKNAQQGSRSGADGPQQNQRAEGNTDGKSADGQGGEAQEQKPKDRPPAEGPSPDAGVDQPGEASRESAPDQQPDDPRWAAVLAAIEGFKAENSELRQKLGDLEARHQGESQELKQKVSDLEAKLEAAQAQQQGASDQTSDSGEQPEPHGSPDVAEPGERRDVLGVGDDTADDADQAGIVVVNGRLDNEAERETRPVSPKRPVFSPEDVEFAKSVAGLAQSAGINIPGVDLVFGGESTRRALEKMPPEDQYRAMRMVDTAGILISGMSPEAAAAAMVTSIVGPAVYAKARDKVHDFMGRMRRKD